MDPHNGDFNKEKGRASFSSSDEDSVEISKEMGRQESRQLRDFIPKLDSDIMSRLGRDKRNEDLKGKQRSDEIDAYLREEGEKMKRHLRILVTGKDEEVDILWKKMRLVEKPVSQEELAAAKVDLKKRIRAGVKTVLFETLDELDSLESGKKEIKDPEIQAVRQKMKSWAGDIHDDTDDNVVLLALGDEGLESELASVGIDFARLQQRAFVFQHLSFQACTCSGNLSFWDFAKSRLSNEFEPDTHDWLHLHRRMGLDNVWEAPIARQDHGGYVLNFLVARCRPKWLQQVVQNVAATVFLTDLSECFDILYEDESVFRIKESILLYEQFAKSKWLRDFPILLVAANVAAFKTKLQYKSLSLVFPEYAGSDNDADGAVGFILDKFLQTANGRDKKYVYRAEFLGSADEQEILEFMINTVLKDHLSKLG